MGAYAIDPTQQGQSTPPMHGNEIEPSVDNPDRGNPDDKAQQMGLRPDLKEALMQVRTIFKESFAPKRRVYVRRALRAIEFFKNNPYILFRDNSLDFDTLSGIIGGNNGSTNSIEAYQYNDNVYQMLGLAFIAALSPDVPKCRFQPEDAEDEEDIQVASKASHIQADNERRNGIKALQKLELLFLWATGSYFCYTRNIVSRDRAGVTKIPNIEMQMQQVVPDRYVCPGCQEVTPVDEMSPFQQQLQCPECGMPLSGEDFYPSYSMNTPTETGFTEKANSMTAMNIFCGLNVDADPDAMDLFETGILDLEGEVNIAQARSAFPELYDTLQEGESGDASSSEDTAKRARQIQTSPSGGLGVTTAGDKRGTYSRCWIQPWAFAVLEKKAQAEELQKLYPDGCRLVTYADTFLQCVGERMLDHWTWCPTIKGTGLYPFGVGDAALDIQVRINDCANTVHAYMDRLAYGTIFYDVDKIDWKKMTQKPLNPGNGTPVSRKDDDGREIDLEKLIYQPQFHIDSKIYEYGAQLVQLAQVIAGVQPQTFGGSDPNVQTMGGQEQALRTALGRMKLFWDQIREEHASRAEQSVRCTIANMEDKLKISKVGEEPGEIEQITLLKSELTGDFLAYAESDEGFPSSYQEIQGRIMELMGHMAKNPFLANVLSDPDTQKVVARYLLPENIKLPGDRERARLKILVKDLAKQKPTMSQGPDGAPMLVPSIPLSEDFDDFDMAVTIFRNWLQENWQLEDNPDTADGFANVLAALRQAAMLNAVNQTKQMLLQQQMQAQGGEPGGAPPGPGGPAPPQ